MLVHARDFTLSLMDAPARLRDCRWKWLLWQRRQSLVLPCRRSGLTFFYGTTLFYLPRNARTGDLQQHDFEEIVESMDGTSYIDVKKTLADLREECIEDLERYLIRKVVYY